MNKRVQEQVEQGKLAEREGRRDDARRHFESALHGLGSRVHASTASALLRWIGRTYHTDGDHATALDCLEAALAVAEQSADPASAGHAINLQAIVHWRLGDLDQSEALYVRARETALVAGEQWLAAMTAQNLGVMANARGDLERALRFYVTALSEYRILGSASEMCGVLTNMGKLYTDMEQWDSASRSLDEAAQIATVLGDVGMQLMLEVNRAELQIARSDFAAARETCLRALRLSETTGDPHVLGEVHKHLGTVSRELGEYVRAEQHFESADVLGHERREPLLIAEIARERGELYRKQGRNREALQQLNRAHRMFTELHAKRDVADLNRMTGRLERYFLELVKHWGESIESKDKHTQGHCERVADLSCALAARAGMEPNELFWFRIGAMLHDVGKLIILPDLLNKPGKLTLDEWELVKRHPAAGVEMLSDVDFPGDTLEIVRSHHERWDGEGYPDGLAGEEIPRSARILCIADVYDALTSRRSYKQAMSHEKAMEVMRHDVGLQFDPELFRIFEDLMKSQQGLAMARAPETRTSGRFPAVEIDLGPPDDLTGLTMRRQFVDAANRILDERDQYAKICLFVIDIDEFKTVNDTYGHLQGDAVLKTIAEALRAQIGTKGLIGRYAGDEFVVLLTQSSAAEARDLATRVVGSIRDLMIPLRDRAGMLRATLSLGAATAEPSQRDFESLFAAADRALYEAKRRGRDTVVWAEETTAAHRDPQLHVRQFVGRKDETRRLVKLLETTLESGPSIVSIIGEAGVGKSTLVRQLIPELRLRAGSLIGGRCFESDVKRPYAPWAEALGAINQLGVGGNQVWKELPRLVPELGAASGSAAQHKYVLFDEVVAYLRTASASRPLVVVLDDMQWADTASWDLLEHVVASLERDRILICITVRAEDAERAVLERMRRLSRDERYSEIPLRRLSEREVAAWLDNVFAHQDTDAAILPLLQRYSEGNPFLTTQILRTLLDDKLVQFNSGRWELRSRGDIQLPAAVAGLMERRLERLSPDTRRILATAAVIGRVFDIDLACAAGAGTEDELLDAVDEGVAHAVLEPVGSGGSTYSFTHSLLVNAMAHSVNARRLSRIHERVAQALETHAPTRLAEIAVHYDRAGNAEKTYSYAMAAGRAATALYAHPEARTFFELAASAAGEDDTQRAVAIFSLAEVAETEGKPADADRLCEEILEDLGPRASVALYMPLRRMRERIRAALGRASTETIAACQSLLIEAIAMGDRSEEAALLGMISQGHSRLGNWDEAEAVARQAADAARLAGDSRALADALNRLGTTMMNRSPAEALEHYRHAVELFQRLDDRVGQARCAINMGLIHGAADDGAEAERAYMRGLEGAKSAHAADLAGLACMNLGVLYLKRGRTDLANERFEEALHAFNATMHGPYRLVTLLNLAHLNRENGHWDKATELYTEVIALAVHTGQPDVELGARAGAALTELALGRTAAASDQARTITARMDGRPGWWFQGREIVEALRIRIASARRDYTEAVTLLKENVEALQTRDLYAAGWLLGECAQALPPDRVPFQLINEIGPRIEAHGYAGLALRFATLRLILNDGPRATGTPTPRWAPTGSEYEPSTLPLPGERKTPDGKDRDGV